MGKYDYVMNFHHFVIFINKVENSLIKLRVGDTEDELKYNLLIKIAYYYLSVTASIYLIKKYKSPIKVCHK